MRDPTSHRPAAMSRLSLFIALHAAACGSTWAASTSWTGAGTDPYWDLPANWSAGSPQSATADALLGAFDTHLRSGSFTAQSLSGTGSLTVTGGLLSLAGSAPSSIGRLVLWGGELRAPTGLVVQALDWRGGSIGESAYGSGRAASLSVMGDAGIAGDASLGYMSRLALHGNTSWAGGTSRIGAMESSTLQIGSNGTLSDHAASGDHRLGGLFFGLQNQGAYVKTGAWKTTIELDDLDNSGSLQVRGGRVDLVSTMPARHLSSTGAIVVDGGTLTLGTYRFTDVKIGGSVSVDRGGLEVTTPELASDAQWDIGEEGSVTLTAPSYTGSDGHADLSAATLDNDGTLRLAAGSFTLPDEIGGDGRLQLIDGATLLVDGGTTFAGSLEMLPGSYPYLGGLGLSIDPATDPVGLQLGGTAHVAGYLRPGFSKVPGGRYRLISAAGGVTGQFDNFDGYDLVYGDTYVDIVFEDTPPVVPEPSAAALILVGLLGLARAGGRRG